ncbi:hypothetical protein MVES_003324 [Malassezia vespertilionis]|uniref:Yhi9p n=2 Tax=Malassezia vespertilionis TaxID=2020962 RepID=A0A2N1J8M0_9BASI|nr:hypothetical protein MVES_003324 [Malassezia vespertilionis]
MHDSLRFSQVDVFGSGPISGNPVAVVHHAELVSDAQMRAFAQWTNLSETTFLLPPTQPGADYRLRIFTPNEELPFAGHPTLGSAHAWLENGGQPRCDKCIVQECGIGLVKIQRSEGGLAFSAPDFIKAGSVDAVTLEKAVRAIGVQPDIIVASNWIDNGPGWLGLLLADAQHVLAIEPDYAAMGTLNIGVMAPHRNGPADYEVRAFVPGIGEDPVTGSLNAGFARWLIHANIAPSRYTARQGTVMRRKGDVHVLTDEEGEIWVGGICTTVIRGSAQL